MKQSAESSILLPLGEGWGEGLSAEALLSLSCVG